MTKIKKRLTQNEEFEIMKIVLDKMLLLGVAIMFFGIYRFTLNDFTVGTTLLVGGALVLITFVILMVKEYEFIKS
jgi:hypothetical protein